MPDIPCTLPDLGEGLRTATLQTWLVQPGESIQKGQSYAVVETAKSLVDLPSPYDGKVITCHGIPGSQIHTGETLMTLASTHQEVATVVGTLSDHTLECLPPTQAVPHPATEGIWDTCLPTELQNMAAYVSQSHEKSVPVTLHDCLRIDTVKQITPRLLLALPQAIKAAPRLNAHYRAHHHYACLDTVDIGMIMHTPQGLLIPVVQARHLHNWEALLTHLADIKSDPLPHCHAQASIMLSNFGSLRGRWGTPLLAPPTVCTLGVGKAYQADHQWWLPLSCTLDHRVAAGSDAALLMEALEDALAHQDSSQVTKA